MQRPMRAACCLTSSEVERADHGPAAASNCGLTELRLQIASTHWLRHIAEGFLRSIISLGHKLRAVETVKYGSRATKVGPAMPPS